jgi:hypothetical protein
MVTNVSRNLLAPHPLYETSSENLVTIRVCGIITLNRAFELSSPLKHEGQPSIRVPQPGRQTDKTHVKL